MDQLIHKFEKTETQYRELKARLGRGEITSEQAKAEIKGMMIQDDTGTYWMMGGKTGKWYKHINNQWQEANPYEEIAPPMTLEPEPTPEPQQASQQEFKVETQEEPAKEEEAPYTLDSYKQQEPADAEPIFTAQSNDATYDADAGTEQDAAFSLKQEDQKTSHTGYQFDAQQDAGGLNEPIAADAQDAAAVSDDSLDRKFGADSFNNFDTQGGDESLDLKGASTVSFTGLSEAEGIDGTNFVQGEGQNVDMGDLQGGSQTVDLGGLDGNFEAGGAGQAIEFGGLETDHETGGGGQKVDFGGLDAGYEAGGGGNQTDFGGLADGYESSTGATVDFTSQSTVEESGFEDTAGPILNPVDTNEFALSSNEAQTAGISIDLDGAHDQTSDGAEDPMFAEISKEPADLQAEPLMTPVPTVAEPVHAAVDAPLPALDESNLTQCVVCQSKVPQIAIFCSYCGANQKELGGKKKKKKKSDAAVENEMVIKSIRVLSFLFFFGGLGLIAGVMLGAAFGVLKPFLGELNQHLPIMLQESRGGLAGGLIFAAIGGIGGFIAAALSSVVLSGIYNLIAYVFGGIRFKVKG